MATESKELRYTILKAEDELQNLKAIRGAIEDSLWTEEGELDHTLLMDTIEGETELQEALTAIYYVLGDKEAERDGVAGFVKKLGERKSRLNKTVETLRNILAMYMDNAGIKSIKTPAGTMSISQKAPGLIVESEADIPADYWKPQPPKLDRAKLAADLKEGKKVAGAGLDNGGISFTSRRA